jgi:hypothetical protein
MSPNEAAGVRVRPRIMGIVLVLYVVVGRHPVESRVQDLALHVVRRQHPLHSRGFVVNTLT